MRAYANLGFDPMAVDGKQYQGPVSGLDDQVIFDNWSKARDQLTKGQPELVSLDESFGLIARVRRSDWLGVALQSAQTSEATPVMSLEKAYKAFEAPAEIEDTLLMNIYQMAVCGISIEALRITDTSIGPRCAQKTERVRHCPLYHS